MFIVNLSRILSSNMEGNRIDLGFEYLDVWEVEIFVFGIVIGKYLGSWIRDICGEVFN